MSLAQAYTQPAIVWPRLVYDGEQLVGFTPTGQTFHGQVVAELHLS